MKISFKSPSCIRKTKHRIMFSDKFKRHKILITSILSVGIIYIFFWEHLTFLPGNVNFSQQLYTTITDIKLANEEQITDKPPDPELLAQKGWKKQQESDDSTNNYPDFFQKSFKVQNSKIITTKTAANTYSDANSDANLDANSLSSSKIIQKSVSSTLKTQKMNNTSINYAESKISGAKSTVAKSTVVKSTVAKTIVEPATVDHAKFPTKPIKILFMTEYRSGSTFISTLLNKHPSIHYMFEPLYLSDNRPQFEYLKHNLTGKQNTIRVQQHILSDYSAFKNCGPTTSIWSFLSEFSAKKYDFLQKYDVSKLPVRLALHGEKLKYRVFGQNFTLKTSKVTKFGSRTKNFERTVLQRV